MGTELFFGTNNTGKLKEIREILGDQYKLLSFMDFPPFDVEETESTLRGNAALKAKAFYEHTGIPCFADDTGLEVAALNGAPGVYSARYAGPECKAADNIRLLLENLKDEEDRSARFLTVIAFYDGKEMYYFEGEVQGKILDTLRGDGGFGYDPVFQPDGYDITFAEMNPEEKNKISHRGKAMKRFFDFIKNR